VGSNAVSKKSLRKTKGENKTRPTANVVGQKEGGVMGAKEKDAKARPRIYDGSRHTALEKKLGSKPSQKSSEKQGRKEDKETT